MYEDEKRGGEGGRERGKGVKVVTTSCRAGKMQKGATVT